MFLIPLLSLKLKFKEITGLKHTFNAVLDNTTSTTSATNNNTNDNTNDKTSTTQRHIYGVYFFFLGLNLNVVSILFLFTLFLLFLSLIWFDFV